MLWIILCTVSFLGFLKLLSLLKNFYANYCFFNQFPSAPKHALFGHTAKFSSDGAQLEFLKEQWRYGRTVNISIGFLNSNSIVMACHPETARLFVAHSDEKTSLAWTFLKRWVGEGLATSSGTKWHRMRKLLTPAFHLGILKGYVPVFQSEMKKVLDKWQKESREGKSVEITDDIHHMAFYSLLKTAFGETVMSESDIATAFDAMKTVGDMFGARLSNPLHYNDFVYKFTSNGKKNDQAIRMLRGLSKNLLDSRKGKSDENRHQAASGEGNRFNKYTCFLELVLNAKDEDGQGLSEEELIDNLQTFMFAGHDTTSHALPFVFYNLAKRPDYQQKCRDEISSVFGENEDFDMERLGKLEFLTMIIKESLRMHTPPPVTSRVCSQPITLPDGTCIPAGTTIGVNFWGIHYNPEVWDDPEVFDPYRFSAETSKPRHSHAFMAFSAGPRNCIGQNFALVELKVCVASTLRRFDLSMDDNYVLKYSIPVMVEPSGGMLLKFKEINK